MAKTKTQQELLSNVRESSLTYNYDLTRVDPREYAAPLYILFNSEIWKDIFIRRNKLFRAAMHGDVNAFRQIDQLDRKVGYMILQAMFKFSKERQEQIKGNIVTLDEYLDDFVRTEEQKELHNDFSLAVDTAIIVADILESTLNDAKDTLKKLDPSLILSEFDSINAATKALRDFTAIHHRDEHEELQTLFFDYVEEVEEYLRMKTLVYIEQHKNLRQSLINSGQIKETKKKKHTDREYLTDILSNYIYNTTKQKMDRQTSFERAKSAIRNFTDEELQEAMPVIIELFRHAESIHMAKEGINATIKSLPETEATKKLINAIA